MLSKRVAVLCFGSVLGGGSIIWLGSYGALHVHAAADGEPGLYSADQAKRGGAEYAKQQCVLCHGADLAGVGQAPALAGDEFLSKYDDQSIVVLFDKMHKSMPATNTGSMTPAQTADIVAYLLSYNKYPAGTTELPSGEDALKKVQLPKPPK